MMTTTHRSWCDGECPACTEFDEHSNGFTIAVAGGPMGEDEPHATVDRTMSVAVVQADEDVAAVVVRPDIWLRSPNSGSWFIPGELMAILPAIRMSATRARYVAMLLMESANLADSINDGRASA